MIDNQQIAKLKCLELTMNYIIKSSLMSFT